MIKNQIKLRQICALFIALLPLTKIITAPSVFARFCGEKLLQPLIVLCVLDLCLIAIFCLILKRHENKSAYQILSENYSEWFAKIIFFIYALFFQQNHLFHSQSTKNQLKMPFMKLYLKHPFFIPLLQLPFLLRLRALKLLEELQSCLFQ